ncbi:hypothetical protein ACJJTC_007622 [Scirpophaga incertulas]
MVTREGWLRKMPCECCAVQFTVFRRKQVCCECERYYCSGCLRREGAHALCAACKTLSTRPLLRHSISHLKVRDLQCFLQRHNVSTRGCVEKEELVSLCVSHVNSAAYRRRGPRVRSSPFSSLKGLTNNLNVFLNNAFDVRSNTAREPTSPTQHSNNCYNASHTHSRPADTPTPSTPAATAPRPERFTTTPGTIETNPATDSIGWPCAIEDLDDAGWEFVTRPADPLPNDSDVLIAESTAADRTEQSSEPSSDTTTPTLRDDDRTSEREGVSEREEPREGENGEREVLIPGACLRLQAEHRAASNVELGRAPPIAADSRSLQDEPLPRTPPEAAVPVSLDEIASEQELDGLSVRQLKLLLARNRVAFRGCLERGELLELARRLLRDHAAYRADIESLPLEECCKICMAAPLECVLLECGHIAACTACAARLAECPVCRHYVVRAVRCFRC